jgi:tetratricopeptide (TPR) repeat protein
VYKIRHEQLAYEFLTFLYCERYISSVLLFDKMHNVKQVIGCFWKNVQSEKLIDALTTCATLYSNNRHKGLSLLLTGDYISLPLDSFRNQPITDKEKLKKLYCYGYGDYYLDIEDYKKAVDYYDKALGVDLDYTDALLNKGFALSKLGTVEDENTCYDRVIEINPSDSSRLVRAWDNKSYFLFRQNKIDEAISTNRRATELEPNYANAWYNKSIYLIHKNERSIEEGLSYLSTAINLDRGYVDAIKNDKDFDCVRSDVRFLSFLGKYE